MRFAALLIAASAAFAQPAFDVVSVKPSEGNRMTLTPLTDGKVTARNIDVRTLIRASYRVQDFQISGSGLDGQRFDIDARSDTPANAADTRLMLQALLADRFHLKLRHDSKEVSAYKLVVPSGKTIKMTKGDSTGCDPEPSPTSPCDQIGDRGKFTLAGKRVAMKNFAIALGSLIGDMVVDQTGLDGVYDFTLDLGRAGFAPTPGSPGNQLDGVNAVISALQDQLGLKLERTKVPVEMLVIDHVEKPAAN